MRRWRWIASVLLSAHGSALWAQGDTARRITGVIADSVTGRGLAGVTVTDARSHGTTRTDRRGRYAIRVASHFTVELTVRHPGFRPARIIVPASAPDSTFTTFLARAPVPLANVIVAPSVVTFASPDMATGNVVDRDVLVARPALGDDPLRALHRLPGVTGADLSASFGVRGGTPDQLLIRLDGVELLDAVHLKDFGGLFLAVDNTLIGSLALSTGVVPAALGNRTHGVLEIETLPTASVPSRYILGASLMGGVAGLTTVSPDARSSLVAVARRGYLDLALQLAGESNLFSPAYGDLFVRAATRTDAHDVAVSVLGFEDHVTYQDDDDPELNSDRESAHAWVRARSRWSTALSSEFVASIAAHDWRRIGVQRVASERGRVYALDDRRRLTTQQARFDLRHDIGASVAVLGGVALLRERADVAHDREVSERDPRGATIFQLDAASASARTLLSAHLTGRARPLASLTLETGLRLDGDRAGTTVDPRASASIALGSRTTLRAAFGIHSQRPSLHTTPVEHGVTQPRRTERVRHLVAGIERRTGDVVGRLEGFASRYTRIGPRTFRQLGAFTVFPELFGAMIQVEPTRAFARGVELTLANQTTGPWHWSVNAASQQVRFAAPQAGGWFPALEDRPASVSVDVSRIWQSGWTAALAWTYHTGTPVTPVSFVVDSTSEGWRVEPAFGALHSERGVLHHRLDVRISRTTMTGQRRITWFIDLYNAYSRRNGSSVSYRLADINRPSVIVRDPANGLPLLPSFGVRIER